MDLPGGPDFVRALQQVWDSGNAALPIDPRLPAPMRKAVIEAMSPSAMIGPDGICHRLAGGVPLEQEDALVVATSGTTGKQKGVVLTHSAVQASALATSKCLKADPSTDRWLACLPLAHIGGLSVVTRALHTGIPLIVQDGFDMNKVISAARSGATLVSLVATALRRIEPGLFRIVLLGASRAPADLPPNVVTTYGMTETGSGVVYDGIPLEGVEVRVSWRDPAPQGELLDPGADTASVKLAEIGQADQVKLGEVLLRCPMLLRCYREGPNGASPTGEDPRLEGGWFPTGDAGWIDENQRLHVAGRIAEVIVTGGEKVWPAAVEAVLNTHPCVEEIAISGQPDPEWGQAVVAWVVPSKSGPPSLEDLQAMASEQLPPWSKPKKMKVVSSLPRTALGKLRRELLR